MPRKHKKVQELILVIKHKIENGFSYRQIAEKYGLDNEKVIRKLMYRDRHNAYSIIHLIHLMLYVSHTFFCT